MVESGGLWTGVANSQTVALAVGFSVAVALHATAAAAGVVSVLQPPTLLPYQA